MVGLVGAVSALAATGCAASPPIRLAPPIPPDPLDLSGYATTPCDLLRADRISWRHLASPGVIGHDADVTSCRWRSVDGTHPSIAAGADMSHDLESVYRGRAGFGSFQPAEVSHYPAADTTASGQRPVDGSCTTRVGVASDSLLIVTATYPGRRSRSAKDPCAAAEDFAFAVITQMLGSS